MTACFSLLLLIAFGLQPGRGTQSVNTKIEITAGGSPKSVRRTDLQAAVLPIPPSVSSDSELSHKILRTGAQDSVVATEESNSPSLVEQSMRRGGAQDPIKFDPAHSVFVGASQEPAPQEPAESDEVVEVASAPETGSETEDLVGAASVVDKVRLCGQKCADVVIEGGAPCDAFFASGCKGPPPKGFTADSTLYELCPIACGPKPEEFSSSLVWLVVLLLVLFVPCIIIGIAAVVIKIFFPKSYEEYSAKAQQVFKDGKKRWNAVTSGGEYYDEWSDEDGAEDEGTDDDNDDYDLASASAVMEESQSQFASQSMSGTAMMSDGSATTMMPGASATTMMPGASATTMMPDGSATTMMPSGTTMMPTMMASSGTMMPTMMQSSGTMMPTMMQSSATMMQSGMMEEQPTMMGTMMGSSMMEEQPTMMGTMMGSSVMESGVMQEQPTMMGTMINIPTGLESGVNLSSTDTL